MAGPTRARSRRGDAVASRGGFLRLTVCELVCTTNVRASQRGVAPMANKTPMKAKTGARSSKRKFLGAPIQHIDITKLPGIVPTVEAMQHMAYSARDLNRAADIYERMLRDKECGIILCLAGSLISAGLKKIFVDMIRANMVDAIVSTGANMVDQDFFEALGFKHYVAPDHFKSGMHDGELRAMAIDRIYDTFIDEED